VGAFAGVVKAIAVLNTMGYTNLRPQVQQLLFQERLS
jgi:hypothetical protein